MGRSTYQVFNLEFFAVIWHNPMPTCYQMAGILLYTHSKFQRSCLVHSCCEHSCLVRIEFATFRFLILLCLLCRPLLRLHFFSLSLLGSKVPLRYLNGGLPEELIAASLFFDVNTADYAEAKIREWKCNNALTLWPLKKRKLGSIAYDQNFLTEYFNGLVTSAYNPTKPTTPFWFHFKHGLNISV